MANTPKKHTSGGRAPKFSPEFVRQAEGLCLLGAVDKDLADVFGVNERTINRWKRQHPKFCQAIKRGKEIADAEIARALYERARGFEFQEEVVLKCKRPGRDAGEELQTITITRKLPPDTIACFFWLKNRQSKVWGDKSKVAAQPPRKGPVPITFKMDRDIRKENADLLTD